MDKKKMAELVTLAQRGDHNALQELLDGIYHDLYYFAYKKLKDENAASDVTQESCIQIMLGLGQLRDPASFSAWAHQITYRQCAQYFRHSREQQLAEVEDGDAILEFMPEQNEAVLPEQVYENKEFQKTMQDMLDALPGDQRTALMLYYYRKMSVKDIAQIQATSEGTVKSRLNYGRKAVKKQVLAYEKETGTKFFSIAPLPLLLYYLFQQRGDEDWAALSKAGTVAGGSAAGSMGAAGGKLVVGALTKQIVGATLAVSLATGAVLGTVGVMESQKEPTDEETIFLEYLQQGTEPTEPGPAPTDPEDTIPDVTLPEGSEPEDTRPVESLPEETKPEVTEPEEPVPTNPEEPAPTNPVPVLPEEPGQDEPVQDPPIPVETAPQPPAVTASGTCGENLAWTLDENGKLVISGEGVMDSAVSEAYANQVREVVIENGVTGICAGAFEGYSALAHVSIGDSVTRIGDQAFYGCERLTSIEIPGRVTIIGDRALCGLPNLKVITVDPENPSFCSVDGVLYNKNQTKLIQCPGGRDGSFAAADSVTTIRPDAFTGCSALVSVTIPEGVTYMSFEALETDCRNLQEIRVDENNPRYCSVDGVLYNKEMTELILCPKAKSGALTIPSGVIRIGSVSGCTKIESVTIPRGVTSLKDGVFRGCISLKQVTIPYTVTSIGSYAFYGCESLAIVTIPISVGTIGSYAFQGCGAMNIYYGGTAERWASISKGDQVIPEDALLHYNASAPE